MYERRETEVNMEKVNMKPDMVFSPQPMYIIGTKNENGTPDFCIITWLGFTYDQTPHIMMTIGGSKQTKTNILRDKKFSANMITEDNLWLADYFGNTRGENKVKNQISYTCKWGNSVDVPIIDECPWVYECEVTRVLELEGSHLFLAEIKNIQIDEKFKTMNMEKIDLTELKPAIYAPYNYFSIGKKLGEMGEWEKYL
jgi:flavin reductase (DIM6/NTAB) family NADH-FMN oxidoreductase RutF